MLSVFKFTSVPNTQRLTACWAQQRIWLLCSRCPLQHTLNHDSRRFMACPRRRKWLDPDLGKKLGGYLGRPLPWWQMAARLWVVGRAGGNGTLGSLREFFLVSEEIQQEEMERFKALQFEECIMYIFFKKRKKIYKSIYLPDVHHKTAPEQLCKVLQGAQVKSWLDGGVMEIEYWRGFCECIERGCSASLYGRARICGREMLGSDRCTLGRETIWGNEVV